MTRPATRRPPGEVRIVGGAWKRTRIPVADAFGLRPTPDRIRETLFNWLGQDCTGWRCVDAFAGTGALGFEAASRGAREVVLIERETQLVARLEAVRARLMAEAVIRIERGDGVGWLRRAAPASADVVFLDPPFDSGLAPAALAAAAGVVAPGGFVYLETAATTPMPVDPAAAEGLEQVRSGRAGAVSFMLFRKAAPA